MVNRCPARRRIGRPPSRAPVRILGPERSARMAVGLWYRAEAARTSLTARACSACVPWEKFRRATSIPARISRSIICAELVAGPSVQTILARRTLAAGELVGGREFMNDAVKIFDSSTKAGNRNAFVVGVPAQLVGFG